jgi:hypothetical protein
MTIVTTIATTTVAAIVARGTIIRISKPSRTGVRVVAPNPTAR